MLGFEDGPESNAEIQFKIKPLGAIGAAAAASDPAVTGAAEAGTGAANVAGAQGALPTGPGSTADLPPTGFGTGGASIVPQAQQVKKGNPTLLTHPLGAQTDDMYESAVAQLQYDTQSRYAQLLQELGFVGDNGQFSPGTLETDATRQRNELERQRGLSLQDVTEAAVRGGTVFSGRRAQNQMQAQQPFDSAISELTTRLSRELASRYQGLGDLTRQFELGRGSLLSEAAERIKQSLMGNAIGGDSADPGAGGPPGGGATAPDFFGGLTQALQQGIPVLSGSPPGSRLINDPQVGTYVIDPSGRRIGRIVNGKFVSEVGKTVATSSGGGGGGGGGSRVQ